MIFEFGPYLLPGANNQKEPKSKGDLLGVLSFLFEPQKERVYRLHFFLSHRKHSGALNPRCSLLISVDLSVGSLAYLGHPSGKKHQPPFCAANGALVWPRAWEMVLFGST